MRRLGTRWVVLLTLPAMLAAGGVVMSAEATLEELGRAKLGPSDFVALLGPISETGRVGWDCAPEHAARTAAARAAELPTDQS